MRFVSPMLAVTLAVVLAWHPERADGHGLPINLFADPATDTLYTVGTFDIGRFDPIAGFAISISPSIGVANPGNGLPDESQMHLDVVSELRFATSDEVLPAAGRVDVLSPTSDNFGNDNVSPVPHYSVDATTGNLTGLLWGTYDSVVPGWDSDGRFVLAPAWAPQGVYSFAIRIASPGFTATDPIALHFVHDPLQQMKAEEIDAAIALLDALPLSAVPGDFNGDGQVSGTDFLIWQANFGSVASQAADGDGDGDGDVDGDDFLIWQTHFAPSAGAANNASHSLPEPATLLQVLVAVLVAAPGRTRRSARVSRGSWRHAS